MDLTMPTERKTGANRGFAKLGLKASNKFRNFH